VTPTQAGDWRLQITADGADAGAALSLHVLPAPLRGCRW
jgi:hypothetical protein